MSFAQTSQQDYLVHEFAHLNLKDKRLNSRAIAICERLLSAKGSCIRALFPDKNEARSAYDFFSNPKIEPNSLLASHQLQTTNRVKELDKDKVILALHDTTILNFTTHKAKIDIGRVGKGHQDYYGIMQHTSLLVTEDNLPLGIAHLGYHDFDMFSCEQPRVKRPLRDKCSSRWVEALRDTKRLCNQSSAKIIHLADREADFYDFFKELEGESFVIRCRHVERYVLLGDKLAKAKLRDSIANTRAIGTKRIDIYNSKTNTLESRELKIQVLPSISIPCPLKKQHQDEKPNLEVNVVRAYDDTYEWILITNLDVSSLEMVNRVLDYYRLRWHIESYFVSTNVTLRL